MYSADSSSFRESTELILCLYGDWLSHNMQSKRICMCLCIHERWLCIHQITCPDTLSLLCIFVQHCSYSAASPYSRSKNVITMSTGMLSVHWMHVYDEQKQTMYKEVFVHFFLFCKLCHLQWTLQQTNTQHLLGSGPCLAVRPLWLKFSEKAAHMATNVTSVPPSPSSG